ncbi:putative permease [Escherichia coli]|uniref:Putative permease n=1 Tax=Escherichia coli TaxID=562 RepID=A0A377AQD2_ECOLX|nr:putative permease [Escherichia coli]
MNWWLLAILYGLAGFGYIIVATFLRSWRKMQAHIVNRPSLDVSRLINCARLLWLAMGSKTLGGFALPDGEFAGAGYQCAAYSRQRLSSLAYH